MDRNDVVGEAEGLSSSESGWTEYISSPIQDHYSEVDDDHDDDDDDHDEDDEDGDSVASDASTGQLLQQSDQYSSLSAVEEDTRDGQTVKEQQRDFKALKGRGDVDDGKAPAGTGVSASKEGAAAAADNYDLEVE